MNRSWSPPRSLQAALGLAVIVLQVLGALHFTLVRHGYSAALGGMVHVHAAGRADHESPTKLVARGSVAVAADSPSCATERCPDANAPQGSAPRFDLAASGLVAFGEARLLSEPAAYSRESLRVFSSAPKTSPPV